VQLKYSQLHSAAEENVTSMSIACEDELEGMKLKLQMNEKNFEVTVLC
jgi:hypothetical protein